MIKLFWDDLKMMIRNRQSLFWLLAFPLIFTVIFGFFFSGNNNSLLGGGKIGFINKSNTPIAQSFQKALDNSGLFKIAHEPNEATALGLIKKGQLAGAISIPENFGALTPGSPNQIKILSDPSNVAVTASMSEFITQFLTNLNLQIVHQKPIYSMSTEKTTNHPINYFDFVLMGLLGFALMNSAIDGISTAMANYREKKILKRITTTPLALWKFIAAEVLSRLVLNFVQVALILAVGYYGFHAHIYGSIVLIFVFAMIGALLFQAMGFVVAALSKTTDAANSMATAITIPMMFLAGVFFPIDSLPKWLYSIVQYLPLAPLLRMIRQIGLDATSPFTNPSNIIIVGIWIVVMLAISIWRFRLSDE